MKKQVALLISGVMSIALLVSGCGGSSEDSSAAQPDSTGVTESSLSKAAFSKQADSICKNGRNKLALGNFAYLKKNPDQTTSQAFVGVVKTVEVPVLEDVAEEIRAIGAPSGDGDQIEAILTSFESAADQLGAKKTFNTPEAQKLLRLGGDKAVAYGIKECGFGY